MLFSMWGGVVADRMNRLKMVRVTRAMFSLLAILTALLIAAGVVQPWHIIAISVGTGVLLSFDIPSRSAMLPALVPQEQLGGAIALYSLVFGGAAILGPALFSPLVGLWGIEGVFFIVGGAYVLTVGVLAFMSEGLHRPEARPSTLVQGLVDGLRYVRGQRVIASVIVLGLTVSLLGSSFQTLLPVFADKVGSDGNSGHQTFQAASNPA